MSPEQFSCCVSIYVSSLSLSLLDMLSSCVQLRVLQQSCSTVRNPYCNQVLTHIERFCSTVWTTICVD